MKVKIVITLLIITPAVMFALELLDPWPQTVPQALVGTWQGETERFVQRWYKGGNYPVTFNIPEDGTVDGTVGNAAFHNAQFRRNRGWIGRMLNMASDYIIKADLEGSLKGEVQCGKVSISLNFDGTELRGGAECSECGEGGKGQRWITARHFTYTRVKRPSD
jgi:hypothetical protein